LTAGTALVARNLRRLRNTSGLSLAALAAASGVAKGTISELERGRGNPTVETLFALAYALEATLADLVSDPPQDEAQVVRAVDRPFVPGSPLDARLLHRSQLSDRVLEVYELLVHPLADIASWEVLDVLDAAWSGAAGRRCRPLHTVPIVVPPGLVARRHVAVVGAEPGGAVD